MDQARQKEQIRQYSISSNSAGEAYTEGHAFMAGQNYYTVQSSKHLYIDISPGIYTILYSSKSDMYTVHCTMYSITDQKYRQACYRQQVRHE